MLTPYYLIDEEILDRDARMLMDEMRAAWGSNIRPSYSVKTNALPWLLNHYRLMGLAAEVVSAEEAELSERMGFTTDRLIYNGPIKDRDTMLRILRGGGIVNIDSADELGWLSDEAASGGTPDVSRGEKTWLLGLRVNLSMRTVITASGHMSAAVDASEEESRFGFSYEDGSLAQAIEMLHALPGIRVEGLHLHHSTHERTVAWYEGLARCACSIAREYALDLSYVDMGGGYFGGVPGRPDMRDYVPAICRVLREQFDPERVTLIMEPGISLLSGATSFVTSVKDVRDIQGERYVVTDGSRLYLNPQVTRREYPHHAEYADDGRTRQSIPHQMICGMTCMEYDRLFDEADAPELAPGDIIVYDRAGGYTMCLAPLFIRHFPAVYIRRRDGQLYTAREPWTIDEYLQKQHWEES